MSELRRQPRPLQSILAVFAGILDRGMVAPAEPLGD
jgi:hypothetical protein